MEHHDWHDAASRCTAGLQVALQHPICSTNQPLLLTMARVCQGWQTAVQQAYTRTLDVRLVLADPRSRNSSVPAVLQQLIGFATWLPKYAGLVRSISITSKEPLGWSWHKEQDQWIKDVAEPVLALGFNGAQHAAAALKDLHNKHFQLQSYSSDIMHGHSILRTLPGSTLTSLDLSDCWFTGIAPVLPQLAKLQKLQLQLDPCSDPASPNIHILAQLTELTSLALRNTDTFDTHQLPTQLQQLTVHYSSEQTPAGLEMGPVSAGFEHLERLVSLDLCFDLSGGSGLPPAGPRLPTQLTELVIDTPEPEVNPFRDWNALSLKHLHRLTIHNCQSNAMELLGLNGLPSLQHLALGFNSGIRDEMDDALEALNQLQQLQSLDICTYYFTASELSRLLHHVTSATKLTRLDLDFIAHSSDIPADPAQHASSVVNVCTEIAKLSMLQDLSLACYRAQDMNLVQGDVLHLSTLRALTSLALHGDGQHITDAALVALALELTNLRSLDIKASTAAAMPAIARLKGLRSLAVTGLSAEEQRMGLVFLRESKQLTRLQGFDKDPAALADFWAAMHGWVGADWC